MEEWQPNPDDQLQGIYGVERVEFGQGGWGETTHIERPDGSRWTLPREAEVALKERDPEIGQEIHIQYQPDLPLVYRISLFG